MAEQSWRIKNFSEMLETIIILAAAQLYSICATSKVITNLKQYNPTMELELPTVANTGASEVVIASEIDVMLIIRWVIYLLVFYRTLEIFINYGHKTSARDRITQRYSIANADVLGTLTREESELMATTIKNTLANVRISGEGLPPKEKKLPTKAVKFTASNLYYPPVVWPEDQEESAMDELLRTELLRTRSLPVPTSGDRMPPVVGELNEDASIETDPTKLATNLARQIAQLEQEVQQEKHRQEEQSKDPAIVFIEKVTEPFQHYQNSSKTEEEATPILNAD